ncbi:MAG: DHA2 family efflux MFS transporter permease subunit [Janthinobacterium lividum]
MASAAATAGPAPLKGARLGVIAFALALGTFMMVLDTTIANVSLPTIAGNLGVSSDNSTWVITAFAVANGVFVPLTGWLMGRFGVVKTFCVAVVMFTLASLLCGLAWSLPSLILFRIFQGAVAGPMMPGSQALLLMIFPPEKRSTALGIWSITALVGPVLGPILGGYISDNYHWSWIFLINVPVGIFTALVCWGGLKDRDTPTRKLPIDIVGLGLLVTWVGCLQSMLDLGKNADWFADPAIIVLAIVAVLGFVAWVIWEFTDANPAVDLSLFRYRNFWVGNVCLSLGYAVMFANLLLLPLWLQTNLGYTATWAGLVSAPAGVVAVLLSPLAARMGGKVDSRLLATVSFLAFAVGYYLRSELTTAASAWEIIVPQLAQGVGMSVFFLSTLTIMLDGIPPERIPSATGISNFLRITGGSFGASIITTAWDNREALHQSRLSEAVANGPTMHATIGVLMGRGMTELQAQGAVAGQMVGQSYLLASTDLFRVSAWIALVLTGLIWLARRPASSGGAAHAAAD